MIAKQSTVAFVDKIIVDDFEVAISIDEYFSGIQTDYWPKFNQGITA